MPSSSKDISSENSPKSKPFSGTNLTLLEQEILSDVTFLAGYGETPVRAHRCLLASRSDVFYAMFCGPLAEKREVRVPDIEPEILKMLFRYLYTEKCTLTNDSSTALLYAAKKYNVAGLAQECREYLMYHLAADNVCTILWEVSQLDETAIAERALHYAIKDGEAVLKSSGFMSLSGEMVRTLVESDYLAADEGVVYKACVQWAKHQCQQQHGGVVTDEDVRECLGELVFFIRFPAMTLEAFAKCVLIDNILTADEKVAVRESLEGGSSYRGTFPTQSRKINLQRVVISRFHSKNTFLCGSVDLHSCDAIDCSFSEDVLLTDVHLLNYSGVSGIFQIVKDSNLIIWEETVGGGFYSAEIITFRTPIYLVHDIKYTLALTYTDGYEGFRSACELNPVLKNGVTVEFYKSDKSDYDHPEYGYDQFCELHLQKFVH